MRISDERGDRAVLHLTDQIIAARDDFFGFVGSREPSCRTNHGQLPHTLFCLFDAWLSKVSHDIEDAFYLDAEDTSDIWENFLGLVPTIYLAIIDSYLADPSRLAYSGRPDASGHDVERRPRTVTSVLPAVVMETELSASALPPIRAGIACLVEGARLSWPIVSFGATDDLS